MWRAPIGLPLPCQLFDLPRSFAKKSLSILKRVHPPRLINFAELLEIFSDLLLILLLTLKAKQSSMLSRSADWQNRREKPETVRRCSFNLGGMRSLASNPSGGIMAQKRSGHDSNNESYRLSFDRRSAEWDIRKTPSSFNLLIHTKGRLKSIKKTGKFYRTLDHETVWV